MACYKNNTPKVESTKDPTEAIFDEFRHQRRLHDRGRNFNGISADEYLRGTTGVWGYRDKYFMPDWFGLYPEYWNDVNINFCPSGTANGAWDESMVENSAGDSLLGVACTQESWPEFWPALPGTLPWNDYFYFTHVIDKGGAGDPQSLWAEMGWGTDDPEDGTTIASQILAFWWHRNDDMEFGEGANCENTSMGWTQDVTIPQSTSDLLNEGLPIGNGGSNTVHALREGIERFMITDINNPGASAVAQTEIAFLWDDVATELQGFNHVPGGGNVLYMDGHVEFQKYPSSDFPINPGWASLLGTSIQDYGQVDFSSPWGAYIICGPQQ